MYFVETDSMHVLGAPRSDEQPIVPSMNPFEVGIPFLEGAPRRCLTTMLDGNVAQGVAAQIAPAVDPEVMSRGAVMPFAPSACPAELRTASATANPMRNLHVMAISSRSKVGDGPPHD